MNMPATHLLKIEPVYFEQVRNGNKTFEIRRDDRGYQKGDIVVLNEYDRSLHTIDDYKYAGNAVSAVIGYVTAYEQQSGFVVFSLNNVDECTPEKPGKKR